MKIYLIQHTDGKDKGKWRWSIESDKGKTIGSARQAHESRSACLQEIKAVQAALPSVGIVEKASGQSRPSTWAR